MSEKRFYILGSPTCLACKVALKKALVAMARGEAEFKFINVQDNRGFDPLLEKYNAVPIYVFPDGTTHLGVMDTEELKKKLE